MDQNVTESELLICNEFSKHVNRSLLMSNHPPLRLYRHPFLLVAQKSIH